MQIKWRRIFTNFLLAQVITNGVYGFTFVQNISGRHNIILQIINGSLNSNDFSLDSPLNYLIPAYFGLQNLDYYLLFTFIMTQISLFIICVLISALGKNSYLFFFAGWLVPATWYLGYADMLTVALTLLILHELVNNRGRNLYKIIFFCLLLTINHSALALGLLLIIFFLNEDGYKLNYLKITFPTYVLGFLINQQLKSFIGFSGRGRFRFLLNDGVITDSLDIITTNFLDVFYSGFLGLIVIFIITTLLNKSLAYNKIYVPILISIIFSCIALDTSRIFSILLVPTIFLIIKEYENINFKNTLSSTAVLISVVGVNLIVGVRHVYGFSRNKSPFIDEPNIYELIIKFLNSIFANILA